MIISSARCCGETYSRVHNMSISLLSSAPMPFASKPLAFSSIFFHKGVIYFDSIKQLEPILQVICKQFRGVQERSKRHALYVHCWKLIYKVHILNIQSFVADLLKSMLIWVHAVVLSPA